MTFQPFHAYEASAGSGKTFSLVVRYLSLLFMGEDADKILALTFTNKAANEMQERIIETLKHLEKRGELEVICEVTGRDRDQILQQRRDVLGGFLNADAKVMTIDKFFAKVLRKFSLHAGLMPTFSTFESQHELKVMARFLTLVEIRGKEEALIELSLLASKRVADLFDLLDELYAKSSEFDDISFESEPFHPYEQRVMETMERLRAIVQENPQASVTAKSGVEAETIEKVMQKSWLERDTFDYRTFAKVYHPEMDDCLHLIKENLAHYMRTKEHHFMSGLLELLALYTEAKRHVAKEDGELSFDDITAWVHYLLKERIESEFLYFRLDSRIDHLLLDEFQDTSVVQFEILRPIIEEMVSGEGAKMRRSLFFVGDVKQSIYRFRGGTKELFYTAAEHYGVTVDRLDTNYRSSRHVVEFVNDVFHGHIPRYESQKVKSEALEGYVEVMESDAVLDTMYHVVQRLLEMGMDCNEIAILTATNADGAGVEEHLHREGIDVVTETTSKLIHQRSVRACIEYLKYSYYGERIYAKNFFALIAQEAEPLARYEIGQMTMSDAIKGVIERYGLYHGDVNILRFLEVLARYKDIEQFLFEYERIDIAAAQMELHGVRVLTVHKSKGLEYDHVIVLDRLGKKRADASPIIYEYDGTRLQHIFLRMKNRAALDVQYAKALEKEKALTEEDALHGLYVAFTRAKSTLFVIQKGKDSKFDLLGLTPQQRGYISIQESPTLQKTSEGKLPYVPLQYGTQSEVLHRNEAISHQGYDAIIFGLALHYTLEMMQGFTSEALQMAMEATQNRYGVHLGSDTMGSIRGRIGRLLAHPKFTQMVQGRCYREQPIAYGGDLRYIDLLIEGEGRWCVVDYKSTFNDTQAHHKQVQQYMMAVGEITQAPVQGYLCYLLEERVELVEVKFL